MAVTPGFVAERQTVGLRSNFTLIVYLTFLRKGAHKSEEMRLYSQETQGRLRRLLEYLRVHVDGVRSVRIYKHALGGLIPTGRGHPATQVLVEVTRLHVLDEIRHRAQEPGELRYLVEGVRERIDTCSSEVVYEVPLQAE